MNKTIFILWFQGFENSPEIIKKCIQSWKHYNSDWTVIVVDNENLIKYININDYIDMINKNINYTALSDVIRISLLRKYGGLWVDATTFCNKSLNEWLPSCISEGFFAFDKPGNDRLLSSWFLYAEKDNYIVSQWFNITKEYYKINNSPHTYFWFHYLFGDLYNSNNIFKEIWDKVPKISANGLGPHYLQEKGMFHSVTVDTKENIDNKITPLYKLSYKCTFPPYNEQINLYYLYSTINKV
jgi:hypothetical protein